MSANWQASAPSWRAPCAIAVAPRGYTQRQRELRTIGVGYDGSQESKRALNAGARAGEASRRSRQGAEGGIAAGSSQRAVPSGRLAAHRGAGGEPLPRPAHSGGRHRRRCRLRRSARGVHRFSQQVDLLLVGSRGHARWAGCFTGASLATCSPTWPARCSSCPAAPPPIHRPRTNASRRHWFRRRPEVPASSDLRPLVLPRPRDAAGYSSSGS